MEAFRGSDEILTMLARGGDLGHQWDRFALCLLARSRVAGLLGLRDSTECIDFPHLANQRARWKSVSAELSEAFMLARHRQWRQASERIRSAMAMEHFSWEAAENLVPFWSLKLGLIFASAADFEAYAGLCERYAKVTLPSPTAKAISLYPLRAAANLTGLFWVDSADSLDPLPSGKRETRRGWISLLNGMDFLRQSNLDMALADLAVAKGQHNYHWACAALTFAAQSSIWRGEAQEAGTDLDKAAVLLERLQRNHDDDLGEHWFELRLSELAFNEARRMRGEFNAFPE
jgi:hypothetical protein